MHGFTIQNKLKFLNHNDYNKPNGIIVFCGEDKDDKNKMYFKMIKHA